MDDTIAALKAEIEAAEKKSASIYKSSKRTWFEDYCQNSGYIRGLQTAVRLLEQGAANEPITDKQIWYIVGLSRDRKDENEELNSILDSIPGDLDVEDLSKGQAMFVIKCLLGEIKPRLWSG